jgi:hypothetical protein
MSASSNINFLPKLDSSKGDGEMPCTYQKSTLENFFAAFQKNIIGHHQIFESPFGKKEIIYADWTASGRAYRPIEECVQKEIMPFVANTHTILPLRGH